MSKKVMVFFSSCNLVKFHSELLRYIQVEKVTVKGYEFDQKKLANVQSQLEKLVGSNYYLNKSAKDAYRSYILAYNSHSMKDIFDVHHLDLQEKAFPLGQRELLSF